MNKEPELLEREAYTFLSENKFEEAFRLFKKSAEIYKSQKNHKQSTLCFASAASCWNRKNEEKTFYNAAMSYENAGQEAEKYGDLEYASLLYKYAAINHERDVEFISFSDCFYRSKECNRKFLTYKVFSPGKINHITKTSQEKGIKFLIKNFFQWLMLTFSFLIWGYGEKPIRTFFTGIFVILVPVVFYMLGPLFKDGMPFYPGFKDAFYFSIVTFTTVGYGDITPLGLSKFVASFEAFFGVFVSSLFIVGLSRKYLRV